jgi:hypothetical protein
VFMLWRVAQVRATHAGNVLQGRVAVGDVVELPSLRETFKVKSLQSFKQDVSAAAAGDRAGICVGQLQPSRVERAFVSAPGLLQEVSACVCAVEKCRFYNGALYPVRACHFPRPLVHVAGHCSCWNINATLTCAWRLARQGEARSQRAGDVRSRQKVHVTVGHQTCMAWPIYFGEPHGAGCSQADLVAGMFNRVGKHVAAETQPFDVHHDYVQQDALHGVSGAPYSMSVLVWTMLPTCSGAVAVHSWQYCGFRAVHGVPWA